MELWKKHTPDSMLLRSGFALSEVFSPKKEFSFGEYVRRFPKQEKYGQVHLPVKVFRHYLNWVYQNLGYPVLADKVKKLDSQKEGGYCAKLESGKKIVCKNVVIACGYKGQAYTPDIFKSSLKNKGKIIHSIESQKIAALKNKKVLVVGGGQSAAESVEVLKKKKNEVSVYMRRSPLYFEQPVHIPAWLFLFLLRSPQLFRLLPLPPVFRRWFNKIISRATVMPALRPVFESVLVLREKPVFGQYDYVVCATGFKADVGRLGFLSGGIEKKLSLYRGVPRLKKNLQSNIPGLFFAGPVTELFFGPAVKFIIGSHFSARVIGKSIQE